MKSGSLVTIAGDTAAVFRTRNALSPSVIVIIIVVIGTQRRRHADAVIGFVMGPIWLRYVGDTAFIKKFIAVLTIVFIVDATLFRSLV